MFPVEWITIGGETIMIDALVYILWSIWTGWIFSTVGAFGGIMAGFGHITVLGLGSKAAAMKGIMAQDATGEQIDGGKLLSDNIRLSNSMLTLVNSVMSTLMWLLQKRLVWAAGLSLGVGAFLGAQIAVFTTGGKLDISELMGIFGIVTFLVSGFMFYSASPAGMKKKTAGKAAAAKFQERVRELRAEGRIKEIEGIKDVKLGATALEFDFFGEHFKIAYLPQVFVGAVVGFIATVVGVGGGFLYVPILSNAFGLPFYIVPGASALAVLVNMISAIIGWIITGVKFSPVIFIGMAGILIGAYIGPKTQKFLPMRLLYIIFGVLSAYVGLRYFLRGFFDIKLFGM